MKPISHQKARAICEAEGLDFAHLKQRGPYLLKTGAKLAWSATQGYQILGYQPDGMDIVPYNRVHGLLVKEPPTKEQLRYAGVIRHKDSLAMHIRAGRVSHYKDNQYIIWCPDDVSRPARWQQQNIERQSTFRIKAVAFKRDK